MCYDRWRNGEKITDPPALVGAGALPPAGGRGVDRVRRGGSAGAAGPDQMRQGDSIRSGGFGCAHLKLNPLGIFLVGTRCSQRGAGSREMPSRNTWR